MRAETLEIQTTRREARRRTVTQKDDTPPVKRAEIYIPWENTPERTLAALGRRPCPEQGTLSPRDSLPAVSRYGPGLDRYATGFVDSQYPLLVRPTVIQQPNYGSVSLSALSVSAALRFQPRIVVSLRVLPSPLTGPSVAYQIRAGNSTGNSSLPHGLELFLD